MPRKHSTEEPIGFALRRAEAGTPVAERCCKLGITAVTFYRWKRRYEAMGWRRSAA